MLKVKPESRGPLEPLERVPQESQEQQELLGQALLERVAHREALESAGVLDSLVLRVPLECLEGVVALDSLVLRVPLECLEGVAIQDPQERQDRLE